MPVQNKSNPKCGDFPDKDGNTPIACKDRPMSRNGQTKAGYQRYRCRICGKSHTDSPNPHGGQNKIGELPLTRAEIKRRYRAKNGDRVRAKDREYYRNVRRFRLGKRSGISAKEAKQYCDGLSSTC